jgi:hypothetical protein
VGARQSLQDYLQPVVPDDPGLKRVANANENAYTIVTMAGTEAQSFSCNKTKNLSPMVRITEASSPSARPTETILQRYMSFGASKETRGRLWRGG